MSTTMVTKPKWVRSQCYSDTTLSMSIPKDFTELMHIDIREKPTIKCWIEDGILHAVKAV